MTKDDTCTMYNDTLEPKQGTTTVSNEGDLLQWHIIAFTRSECTSEYARTHMW